MAGIYVEGESKVLSGVYSLIVATSSAITRGTRGIVAYPFTADWGPVGELVKGTVSDLNRTFNATASEESVHDIYVHAANGEPTTVIGYRMAAEDAAVGTATVGKWEFETKYPSARPFVLSVVEGVEEGTIKMTLVENGVERATFTTGDVETLKLLVDASDYLKVKKADTSLPTATAGVQFTGGKNGSTVTAAHYSAFLDEIQADGTANAFALDGVSDDSIVAVVVAWLKEVRNEGFYVSFVNGGPSSWDMDVSLANVKSKAFNYRPIVNVGNACDGYTPAEMAIFIAARVASVALNSSLTDETVPYTSVNKRLNKQQRITAKQAGTLVFVMNGDTVEIDEAVNTLTNPKKGEVKEFGKIRVSSTVDYVTHDLEAFGEEYKKGKSNTDTFRATYAELVQTEYINPLIAQEILRTGCYYMEDPDYYGDGATRKAKIDEAFFVGDITPNDSPERIYQRLEANF